MIRRVWSSLPPTLQDWIALWRHDGGAAGVSFSQRVRLNFAGFYSDRWHLYALAKNNIADYVSDIDRYRARRRFNGNYNILLDDKMLATLLLSPHIACPPVCAFLRGGNAYEMDGRPLDWPDVYLRIKKAGAVMTKPLRGAAGRGIEKIAFTDGVWSVDGRGAGEGDIVARLKAMNNVILSGFVQQHEYASRLFPPTTNTMRVLTIREPKTREVMVPAALHRIGTKQTVPVDNWSRGGMAAPLDVDAGTLGRAARKGVSGPTFLSEHPDSGAQIEGVQVPDWSNVKEAAISAHTAIPQLNFMAWDLVLTEDGPCAIEANASTDVDLFQVHWPWRSNKALWDFYKHHGVL